MAFWATKSEGVALIVRAISFEDFQASLCGPDPPTLETGGRTDDMQYRAMQCIAR